MKLLLQKSSRLYIKMIYIKLYIHHCVCVYLLPSVLRSETCFIPWSNPAACFYVFAWLYSCVFLFFCLLCLLLWQTWLCFCSSHMTDEVTSEEFCHRIKHLISSHLISSVCVCAGWQEVDGEVGVESEVRCTVPVLWCHQGHQSGCGANRHLRARPRGLLLSLCVCIWIHIRWASLGFSWAHSHAVWETECWSQRGVLSSVWHSVQWNRSVKRIMRCQKQHWCDTSLQHL